MWLVPSPFFDIRSGERALVARSAATLFGLIAAHTLLETTRDALFLGRLPASRLTIVYAVLAALSLLAAQANARFIRAFGRRNSLVFSLLGACFGTVVFYLLEPTPVVVFGLYLWTGLLGSILVVQFWMLLGHRFTVAQGKRLFGLLTAGGVLGAAAGAGAAVILLDVVGVQDLLVVASGCFLLTGLAVTTEAVDEVPAPEPRPEGPRKAVRGALGLIQDYPYLLRLGILVGVSTAAVLATDYLFKSTIAASRPPGSLGPFFAVYYAVLNSVALAIQLLASSPVVRRLGVLGAFLVLPTLLAIGAAGSLVLGGLVGVLLTKGADGALRHSLHRIASELLWMPLPEHVRARAKGILDTVVVRGTQAATAGVLAGLAYVGLDRPGVVAAAVLALSGLWWTLGFGLRRPYLDLFRRALNRKGDRARLELDLRSVEVVVESLSSPDPQLALAAIDLLAASGRTRLIPALILYRNDAEVLARALGVLPAPGRRDWIPLAERLLTHPSETVRVSALDALGREGHRRSGEERLLDISPRVRAHAAFWLSQNQSHRIVHSTPELEALLAIPEAPGQTARIALLEAVGRSDDARWADLVLELADAEDPEVAQAAVRAMTQIRDPRFIPSLIPRLAARDGRTTVREAIVALGAPAFDALEEALTDAETPFRVRVHIPGALARFGNRRAAEVLLDTLEHEPSGRLRYKTLRALRRVARYLDTPADRRRLEDRMVHDLREYFRMADLHLQVERGLRETSGRGRESGVLLEGLLGDKRNQALDRVFLLLQVSFPQEDLRSIRSAAYAPDRGQRAQAQEFLDALTLGSGRPELRALLRLAVDDLPVAERLERGGRDLGLFVRSEPGQVWRQLLFEPDESVASLTACHLLESGRTTLDDEVWQAVRARGSATTALGAVLRNYAARDPSPRPR